MRLRGQNLIPVESATGKAKDQAETTRDGKQDLPTEQHHDDR